MADHADLPFLYTAGDLEAKDREDFERHLPGCPECRQALESSRWGASLAAAAARAPSADLNEKVLEGVRAGAGRPAALSLPWRLGLGFGLAFAAAVLVVRPRAPEPPPEWRNGIESGMTRLREDIDRLDADLSSELWSVEYEQSLDDLDLRRRRLEAELAGPGGG